MRGFTKPIKSFTLKQRDVDELNSAIFVYENTKTAMDQTIRTLRHSAHYIANSAKYDYSNGPLQVALLANMQYFHISGFRMIKHLILPWNKGPLDRLA